MTFELPVIVVSLPWEGTLRAVSMIESGKGFLASTADLPTHQAKEKENWTQLRTETLFKVRLNWKRVLVVET